MKKYLFITLLLSSTLHAGICEIKASSDLGIRFMEGYVENIGRVSIDECARRGEELVGKKVTMSSMIRNENRTVTSVKIKYADKEKSFEGIFYAKH